MQAPLIGVGFAFLDSNCAGSTKISSICFRQQLSPASSVQLPCSAQIWAERTFKATSLPSRRGALCSNGIGMRMGRNSFAGITPARMDRR